MKTTNIIATLVALTPVVAFAQVTPTAGMTSPNSNMPLNAPAWTLVVQQTGDVMATVGGFDFGGAPGYTNLMIFQNVNMGLGTNYPSGGSATFDLGTWNAGDELVFSLLNPNGDQFFSGSASNMNPDGFVHANVWNLDANDAVVDFEDLRAVGNGDPSGADWNYGDAKIVVSNAQAVPEPAPMIVLGLGAIGLFIRRRS
jgi:hypothetical protein